MSKLVCLDGIQAELDGDKVLTFAKESKSPKAQSLKKVTDWTVVCKRPKESCRSLFRICSCVVNIAS